MKLTGPIRGPVTVVSGSQRILVPAYYSPRGSLWKETTDAIYDNLTTAVLVMNPNNGPGAPESPITDADIVAYRTAMDYCQDKRQSVIGYVKTRQSGGDLRPTAA